ncbi:MAG: protein phosphatase 2C domain-containing protein [Spirochaetaceae bacterium]|jgi:protein phosphatase|nr:protein phosphatase 2C domain-containing protein [Spirochaetaceae bacterium]
MKDGFFKFSFSAAGGLDIGKRRSSNQDKVICCPDSFFFGVSDGMGGMPKGGETSECIAKDLPDIAAKLTGSYRGKPVDLKNLGEDFKNEITSYSDKLFRDYNAGGDPLGGATFCGVLLADSSAVFVNLGDSRAYILKQGDQLPRQITEDHNLAAEYVRRGVLTKEQAKNHHSSSQLVRFMSMEPPAEPDCFVEELNPGDTILLCSDGLYGMIDDNEIGRLLGSDKNPDRVCNSLIAAANKAGGRDNISVVLVVFH